MTITNRTINNRLGHLETCAEKAPEDTYESAKALVEIIHDQSDAIRDALRAAGFKGGNDDNLRNLECAIFMYAIASNPERADIIVAEGFGQHADGPAGARVIAQAACDRDALKQARGVA